MRRMSLQAAQGRDDCFDAACPRPVVRCLDSSRGGDDSGETEPLSRVRIELQASTPAAQAKG